MQSRLLSSSENSPAEADEVAEQKALSACSFQAKHAVCKG